MSESVNILVVEDESIVSKDIQMSLKKLGYNVVGAASNGDKALELAKEFEPDLVLMDIMLKGKKNGIEVAAEIKEILDIPVVFLTAYADESTLNKAKVTEPYGYIIKPFKEVDIQTSIEMALYKHKKVSEVIKERDWLFALVDTKTADNMVFVKSKSKMVKLKTSEIIFVEALKDYVTINTANGRYTIHSTMKEIQNKLSEKEFIRIHRSYIVQIQKIATVEGTNLTIEGHKEPLPIGASFKDNLHERLKFL
jgi:DNA-binding LytR/AlgR family response regulator